ncbi:MAG: flagellar basal body P-ring formation protein FlgA [Rhodospirillaceae bacterium]|nr:flagellar basal body P-ring formation protein FlgA [Rhodospirillaceae bacterium]
MITLGDLFTGLTENADKAVAEAPRPGQRSMLSAEWLASVAKANGIAWRPANQYDRVIVFRAGQTVPAGDILAAVKAELMGQGLPQNFGLKFASPLSAIAIPANAPKTIAVREAYFDAAAHVFSAVVEVPAGDPRAHFVQVKGDAFAVVTVPVVKQALSRDAVITADMIDMVEMPESKIGADTLTNADLIIGKAAKGFVRAGQTLRSGDVHLVSFVKVPVFRNEMRRGLKIAEAHLDWIDVNANELPGDAAVDADQLIGYAPKRQLAAGQPLRTTDVQPINMVDVPVAARDIRRGETVTAADIRWTAIDRSNLAIEAIQNEDDLVGRIANSIIRSGQPFRTHNVSLPVVVPKGKVVTLIYNVSTMKLTAKAKVLEDGALGQVVRVVNTKSNVNLFAEVIDADTVRITEQQAAMN